MSEKKEPELQHDETDESSTDSITIDAPTDLDVDDATLEMTQQDEDLGEEPAP